MKNIIEDIIVFLLTVVLPLGLIFTECLFIKNYIVTKKKKWLISSLLFSPIAFFSVYILVLMIVMVFIGTG